MRSFIKKLILLMAICGLCAAVCGCMAGTPDDLYSLPESSDRYIQIQNKVDELQKSGMEYAAPTSGYNRQAIQLHDLNGDGVEEAVVFFRTDGADKKPLNIYILTDKSGECFEVAAVIEGEGTGIDSVAYIDMNGDGVQEIIVGWQMTSSVKNFSIYSIKDYQSIQLAVGGYSNYTYMDVDNDGDNELIVINTPTAESAGSATMYMLMDDGEMVSSSAYLSVSAERVSRMQTGSLTDRKNAVFIDSICGDGIITDVLTYVDGSFTNVTLDNTTMDSATARSYSVYCTDVNNDGIIEIPKPEQFLPQSETVYYAVRWDTCTSIGQTNTALVTYHNYSDGWYMILPDNSIENITIRREDRVSGERAVIFSVITGETDENGNPVLKDYLEIYSLTGDNREDRASLSNRFVINRKNDQIFAAWIMPDGEQYVSEEYIRNNFKIIYTTWLTGTV